MKVGDTVVVRANYFVMSNHYGTAIKYSELVSVGNKENSLTQEKQIDTMLKNGVVAYSVPVKAVKYRWTASREDQIKNMDIQKGNKTMSKAYEFLKECGIFFVLTLNGDYPAGRPFGVVMEVGEDLYISTNDFNQAHKQLRANGHIQIIAKKPSSREWIRITGTATECDDAALRQKMYEENPILQKHHDSAEAEHFLMFKIKVENVEIK